MTTYYVLTQRIYSFDATSDEEAQTIASDLDQVEEIGGCEDETTLYVYKLEQDGTNLDEVVIKDYRE